MAKPVYRLGDVSVAVAKSGSNHSNRYASLGAGKSPADSASWEDAEQEALWRTVVAITDAGDAVTLAKTRDGGAVSLVILSGDDRIRRYARGADEIAALLNDIRVSLEATD